MFMAESRKLLKGTHFIALFIMALVFVMPVVTFAEESAELAEPRVYSTTFYGLQQLDDKPANGRKPLLLIHGISPESGDYDGWGNFIQTVQRQNDMTERLHSNYKVYLFRYSPKNSLIDNSGLLVREFNQFGSAFGNQSVTVLAHSLGGLLIKNVMMTNEPVNQKINRVVTIGTPFHGTPLADPDWLKARFESGGFLGLKKLPTKMAYSVTENKFPYFQSDFCWDNFDDALPSALLVEQEGMCPHRHPDNGMTRLKQARIKAVSDKFITYSSFFGKDEDIPQDLLTSVLRPDQAHLLKFPEDIDSGKFSKHAMMEKARKYMTEIPLSDKYQANSLMKSLFELNDGVSPVVSHLWLGRFVADVSSEREHKRQPVIEGRMINAFKELPNKAQVRLFQNLDHRDWMEGSSRLYPKAGQDGNPSVRIADIFHPESGKKTVFEWLLVDILPPVSPQSDIEDLPVVKDDREIEKVSAR